MDLAERPWEILGRNFWELIIQDAAKTKQYKISNGHATLTLNIPCPCKRCRLQIDLRMVLCQFQLLRHSFWDYSCTLNSLKNGQESCGVKRCWEDVKDRTQPHPKVVKESWLFPWEFTSVNPDPKYKQFLHLWILQEKLTTCEETYFRDVSADFT